MKKHSCENCKWYDVVRGVGSEDDIPTDPDGERRDFCGYYEKVIAEGVVSKENKCSHFVYIFDDFYCKACAVCTKEADGECSNLMCKNCATCSLKHWGTCRYVKCHDCGFCEYYDTWCYQDTWRESFDIYLVERFHDTVME